MSKEVVIVGAGIVGCATAYFLAREGVQVTVLDPAGIAAGASGRNNGLIEHPYDDATADLFDETVALLREALGEAMPPEPVGTLLICESAADAQAALAYHGRFPALEAQLLTPAEAREAEPLLAADLWACMLRTGYPISPAQATIAFAEMARRAGADFELGSSCARYGYGPGVITATADLESCDADAVVLATGAGTRDLLPQVAVAPLWGVIVSVELPSRPRHPLIEGTLAAAQSGAAVENVAPFTLLDSPSHLAVGSTMLAGDEPDGSAWAPRLLERGARFVPSIEKARSHGVRVCARPRSFDNRPILGRVPGEERLWIATGHGGRGMSLGAATGRLMAEAILAGSDAAIPAELSASRLNSPPPEQPLPAELSAPRLNSPS